VISIVANGVFYRSLVAFCKEQKLDYSWVKAKTEESDEFDTHGYHIKVFKRKSDDPVLIKPPERKPVVIPLKPKDERKSSRQPLLSRVETVGIGTNWRG
jgi:hypothetical protein